MLHTLPPDQEGYAAFSGNLRIGPFSDALLAGSWAAQMQRSGLTPVTAREFFEGSVSGDGTFLFSSEAFEEGLHPYTEVNDVLTVHDNGRVVIDLLSSSRSVAGDTVLLMAGEVIRTAPMRPLPPPVALPASITADRRRILCEMPSGRASPGILAVIDGIEEAGIPYLVCWRRDGRAFKDLPVLDGHSTLDFARRSLASLARTHLPPPRTRLPARIRDSQRNRLYRWETGISPVTPVDDAEGARAYIAAVYSSLGISDPPPVSRSTRLENFCYWSPAKGIVLAKDWGASEGVLLHEAAHHLAWKWYRKGGIAGHGPEFTSVYMYLLERFAGADPSFMRKKALACGVSFLETFVPPVVPQGIIGAARP